MSLPLRIDGETVIRAYTVVIGLVTIALTILGLYTLEPLLGGFVQLSATVVSTVLFGGFALLLFVVLSRAIPRREPSHEGGFEPKRT